MPVETDRPKTISRHHMDSRDSVAELRSTYVNFCRCCFRHAPGAIPSLLLNDRTKLAASENSNISATSSTVFVELKSITQAKECNVSALTSLKVVSSSRNRRRKVLLEIPRVSETVSSL